MGKYNFGNTSNNRLLTCHPDLQTIFRVAIADENCPFDFSIVCGERMDEEDQEEKFRLGYSRAHFGESPHNYSPSLAVDAIPYVDGKGQWKDKKLIERLADHICLVAARLYDHGTIEYNIIWGGDFRSFYDGPHYAIRRWRELKDD